MEQIELYYTSNLKYLKLGKYERFFENESIDEMLACIKNQNTPVKIRSTKENLIKHQLSDKSKSIYTYEEIIDNIFDEIVINQDIQNLYNGVSSYIKYSVKPEWQEKLGKFVYLVKDSEMQRKIVENNDCFAFTPDDLSEVKESLEKYGDIRGAVLLRCFFNGKDVNKILSDLDYSWIEVYN